MSSRNRKEQKATTALLIRCCSVLLAAGYLLNYLYMLIVI